MKKHHVLLLTLILLMLAAAVPLTADSYISFTYSMAQPFGELKDFTSEFSWRGWGFSYRNLVRDRLSLGLSVAWQIFSEKQSGTFVSGPVTATGTNIRYASSLPLMATGHVYTGDPGGFRLYGGLGVGAFYLQDRFDFGLYSFYDNHWHFGLVPEAGVMVPLGGSLYSLLGNVIYNYAFGTSDYDARSYLGINVGFVFGQ